MNIPLASDPTAYMLLKIREAGPGVPFAVFSETGLVTLARARDQLVRPTNIPPDARDEGGFAVYVGFDGSGAYRTVQGGISVPSKSFEARFEAPKVASGRLTFYQGPGPSGPEVVFRYFRRPDDDNFYVPSQSTFGPGIVLPQQICDAYGRVAGLETLNNPSPDATSTFVAIGEDAAALLAAPWQLRVAIDALARGVNKPKSAYLEQRLGEWRALGRKELDAIRSFLQV